MNGKVRPLHPNEAPSRGVPRTRPGVSASLVDILFSPNRLWLMSADAAVIGGSYILAFWASPFGRWGLWSPVSTIGCAMFVIAFLLAATGMGLYERLRRHYPVKVVLIAAGACLIALPVALSATYLTEYTVFGRRTILYGAAGGFCGLALFRTTMALLYRNLPYRFAVIGKSSLTDEYVNGIASSDRSDFRHMFHVELEKLVDDSGNLDPYRVRAAGVSDFVVAQDAWNHRDTSDMALCALQHRYRIIDEVDFYAQIFERIPIDHVSVGWILGSGLNPRNLLYSGFKRMFDVTVSLAGILLIAPLLIVIGILIKLTSRGPIIFRQPRQGRYQNPFTMFKFRTMKEEDSKADASGGFTAKGDQRVTAIGRIIRPLHLDELPQLINILIGDMSLVGPRPEALDFARRMAEKIPAYELRYLLRPGLTGHAQIQIGYMMDNVSDTKTKLSFDMYYLTNQSMSLDIRLMLRTVFVVLKRALTGE